MEKQIISILIGLAIWILAMFVLSGFLYLTYDVKAYGNEWWFYPSVIVMSFYQFGSLLFGTAAIFDSENFLK